MNTQQPHDGGPAFPITSSAEAHKIAIASTIGIKGTKERNDSYTAAYSRALSGMSLRDWFAGMALQGIILNTNCFDNMSDKHIAENAYKAADAMLAARGKDQQ